MAIHIMFLPQYTWPVRAENRNRLRLTVPVEENINDFNFYKLFGQYINFGLVFEQGTVRTAELNNGQLTEKTH